MLLLRLFMNYFLLTEAKDREILRKWTESVTASEARAYISEQAHEPIRSRYTAFLTDSHHTRKWGSLGLFAAGLQTGTRPGSIYLSQMFPALPDITSCMRGNRWASSIMHVIEISSNRIENSHIIQQFVVRWRDRSHFIMSTVSN
jgi:hypothetical protein